MLSSSNSSSDPANAKIDIAKVYSHVRSIIDDLPTLAVKLEGSNNFKEWRFEYTQKLFQWDISYRHFITKKLTPSGDVSDDVKSYYSNATKNDLVILVHMMNMALFFFTLNNTSQKLDFDITNTPPEFHVLWSKVVQACKKRPHLSQVAEFKSAAKSFLSTENAMRHAVIYGPIDWKFQILAGILEPNRTPDDVLEIVMKAIENSGVDKEFKQIGKSTDTNFDTVQSRTVLVYERLIKVVEDTLKDRKLVSPFKKKSIPKDRIDEIPHPRQQNKKKKDIRFDPMPAFVEAEEAANAHTGSAKVNKLTPDQIVQRIFPRLHSQFGHPNAVELQKIQALIPRKMAPPVPALPCKACDVCSPMTAFPEPSSHLFFTKRAFEITHVDIRENFKTAYDGSRFLLTMVDHHTMYAVVKPLKTKQQVMYYIENYFQTYIRIFKTPEAHMCYESDCIMAPQLDAFCEENDVQPLPSQSFPLEGSKTIAERWQKIIEEKGRCLLAEANAPEMFWPAALKFACFQINATPNKTLKYQVPYLRWHEEMGHELLIPFYEPFGSLVYYTSPDDKGDLAAPYKGKRNVGCYLGRAFTPGNYLVLSCNPPGIVEVKEFTSGFEFFFKKYRLDVSGMKLDSKDRERLDALFKPPSLPPVIRSEGESVEEKKLQTSLLLKLFNNWEVSM